MPGRFRASTSANTTNNLVGQRPPASGVSANQVEADVPAGVLTAGGNCHVIPPPPAPPPPTAEAPCERRRRRRRSGPIPRDAARLAQRHEKKCRDERFSLGSAVFFMILSIFNDINALKRLGCQTPEAQWDVQPSEAFKATEPEHGEAAIHLEQCDI